MKFLLVVLLLFPSISFAQATPAEPVQETQTPPSEPAQEPQASDIVAPSPAAKSLTIPAHLVQFDFSGSLRVCTVFTAPICVRSVSINDYIQSQTKNPKAKYAGKKRRANLDEPLVVLYTLE